LIKVFSAFWGRLKNAPTKNGGRNSHGIKGAKGSIDHNLASLIFSMRCSDDLCAACRQVNFFFSGAAITGGR
jgi:hypothetical protein